MKKILFFSLVVGLLTTQASADMYIMDSGTAINLRPILSSWSDGFNILNNVSYIGSNPGGPPPDKVFGLASAYGATHDMFYLVGFKGSLNDLDTDGDDWASVDIGAADNTNSVLTALQSLTSFDEYGLYVANDNAETWQYKLYAEFDDGSGGTDRFDSPSWTPIDAPGHTFLTLDFGADKAFNTLKDIGFTIKTGPDSTGDTFHTSVVPVPAAVLLGMLGMGVAGLKLRKHA